MERCFEPVLLVLSLIFSSAVNTGPSKWGMLSLTWASSPRVVGEQQGTLLQILEASPMHTEAGRPKEARSSLSWEGKMSCQITSIIFSQIEGFRTLQSAFLLPFFYLPSGYKSMEWGREGRKIFDIPGWSTNVPFQDAFPTCWDVKVHIINIEDWR